MELFVQYFTGILPNIASRSCTYYFRYSTKPPCSSAPAPPRRKENEIRVLPLLALFIIGSGSYAFLVKKRAAEPQQPISGETVKTGRYQR